ncbi:MAG: cupredoxin family copper-binding protein [Steroidobacteraceae bacterium]
MNTYQHRVKAAAVVLLGCGALWGPAGAQTADPAHIVVKNFMFEPMSLTVKAGSTVIWTNMDEEPHTVVSGQFRSGALDTKDNFSFKFDKPGTYSFVCSIHPQMVGTIIVQ